MIFWHKIRDTEVRGWFSVVWKFPITGGAKH